jgi:glycolate oxidase iron-sulfur subunit
MDCCGLGGVFGVISPQVSLNLGQERLSVYQASGAKVLATGCSGCLVQLNRLAPDLNVVHLLELIA